MLCYEGCDKGRSIGCYRDATKWEAPNQWVKVREKLYGRSKNLYRYLLDKEVVK